MSEETPQLPQKHYRDMTPDERAVVDAWLEKSKNARPEAIETDAPQAFNPGIIIFQDAAYRAVSPDIPAVWPRIEWHINALLRCLPYKHRLEYWKGRIERGKAIALAFFDAHYRILQAGILSPERNEDGSTSAFCGVFTTKPIDLTQPARIAEVVAVAAKLDQVRIWTPYEVPMVDGYRLENSTAGWLQVMDAKPIQ